MSNEELEKWKGNERRADSTSVRLALLERSYFENKDSLIAVHRRITETASIQKQEMRIGFEEIKSILKEDIGPRLSKLEAWRNWLTGAYATAAIVIGAWFSHHKIR